MNKTITLTPREVQIVIGYMRHARDIHNTTLKHGSQSLEGREEYINRVYDAENILRKLGDEPNKKG